MDNKKLCPLIKAYCLDTHCAWYCVDSNNCSIENIATALSRDSDARKREFEYWKEQSEKG